MQLGTSTNLLYIRPDGSRVELPETLKLVSEAGFRVFDLNFYDWSLPGSIFLTEDWERWIDGVAETAADLGVTFGQCHTYFYDFLDPSLKEDKQAYHQMLQQRSFECCRRLNAHTCVLHPETYRSAVSVVKKSFQANTEFFKPLIEQMESLNMRLAIENMCDYGISPKRKFCADPEELVAFVDSFGSDRIGICWDFEHADIMEQNQREALHYMGSRLFATHVSDTFSKTDNTLMHVLPMMGNVNWKEVMISLREIGYQGDFCYEVHNYMNRMPDAVIPTALKLAYEIGEYLMRLSVN